MSAVEEIQAAIEKLTAVKNEPIVTALFTVTLVDADWFSRTSKKLAILHRTIDAQLAILTDGLADMMSRERLGLPLNTGPVRTLALARAINGVTR